MSPYYTTDELQQGVAALPKPVQLTVNPKHLPGFAAAVSGTQRGVNTRQSLILPLRAKDLPNHSTATTSLQSHSNTSSDMSNDSFVRTRPTVTGRPFLAYLTPVPDVGPPRNVKSKSVNYAK